MQDTLLSLVTDAKQDIERHKEILKSLVLGKDAIIKSGYYKGRRGRCTGVIVSSTGPGFLVQPYRLDGHIASGTNGDLLWDRSDARTYWPIEAVDFEIPKE